MKLLLISDGINIENTLSSYYWFWWFTFPSCGIGEFKLYIRVSPDAFVWCSVSPAKSICQMAEVYPFVENNDDEIFGYK
jgi:hypothetical protein